MKISSFTLNVILVLPLVIAFAIPGEAKQPEPVAVANFIAEPAGQAVFGRFLDPHAAPELSIVLPASLSDLN
jgi:hypothetical protein